MTSVGIRGTNWSVTINNPMPADMDFGWVAEHPGWSIEGQMEVGKEGTPHYQGLLRTPNKPSFSTVHKLLPRAHLETARNVKHLEAYVHKDETRVAQVDTVSSKIPTLFAYQTLVAQRLSMDNIGKCMRDMKIAATSKAQADYVMEYHVDRLVNEDIRAGVRGIEYIAINPMWIASWRKFWRSIIIRDGQRSSYESAPRTPSEEGSPFADNAPSGHVSSPAYAGETEVCESVPEVLPNGRRCVQLQSVSSELDLGS
ncbi:MAG: replication-associated protein [Cressdnaviricota sp.]|nr:MAG: replication-associated protein [Cressdnaviricota sp.]